MLSSSKISLREGHFRGRGFAPQRIPKFCPNNCYTNIFLHYGFQLSMLSCSKNFTLGGPFLALGGWRFASPRGSPNLVQTIVSQTSSYITSFNFLCWAVQKFHLGRAILRGRGSSPPEDPQIWFPGRPLNLVQTVVSQTTFNTLSMFRSSKVSFWEGHFGGLPPSPGKTLKFGPSIKNT